MMAESTVTPPMPTQEIPLDPEKLPSCTVFIVLNRWLCFYIYICVYIYMYMS